MNTSLITVSRRLVSAAAWKGWVRGTLRGLTLGLAVVLAGGVGGFFGHSLAGAGAAGMVAASQSIGMPDGEGILIGRTPGKFEKLGRGIDEFNAGMDENLDVIGRLAHFVLAQGWREFMRALGGPPEIEAPTPKREVTAMQQPRSGNIPSSARS